MRVLVTGGAGFIGSNFVHMLLEKHDHEIVVLDKLTYAGNLENLKGVQEHPKFSFVKGDICDKGAVEAVKDCDIVFNFAAETHVDRSIIDAGTFVSTDVMGTYRLLEAARKYEVEKFVQISTDEVYGSVEDGSFRETDILDPSSPYSASKSSGDLLTRSYFITYGLPVFITRSSNNFGPYQHPEKLIPKLITNAVRDISLPIYGEGKNVRDWIYVTDNCEGIYHVLEKGKDGEVYNVGGGNEWMNIDIAKLVLKELGKPESLIEFVEDRLGHDWRYSLDCAKIHELGWRPRYQFADAMKETLNWYVENREWWEKLV